ncbi:MAG: class I SAM-dependent methyltransferase [Bacteroidia bacterium]
MQGTEIIHDWLNETDIYLIDQILKRRFTPGMKILDAGCGDGRNLNYFLHNDYMVYGVDSSEIAIHAMRKRASRINQNLPQENFFRAAVEKMDFDDSSFDVVISNAVLHFSKDTSHFREMMNEMWRVLRPGGIFFCRLASSIGLEKRIQPLEERHFLLPDGTKRFLVDETFLLQTTHKLGARFLEPIKTVNVQNSRCMTTWVLGKQ